MVKNELQILVDILEEAFEERHNHETYADRVLFAKFLIDHGILIANTHS